MTEVSFYQLKRQTPERVLLRLLEKAVKAGKKAVVRLRSEEEVDAFDTALWAVEQDSFLPHGTRKSKAHENQPVFLTMADDNPNQADFVFVLPGAPEGNLEGFERVFFIFEGNVESQVKAAREKWTAFKEGGGQLAFWAQTEQGGWEKKQ